ncbi:MAG TPA: SHOCT domain-containing protein [Acidimicrobiales bacterium]|jgi:hypothetical protein|nr:SHOCT domain-containing protein [Acidimicrobiales bacterium]
MAVGTAVVAGTASAVARRTASSQQAAAAPQHVAAAPDAAPEDPYAKLKELGALHDQGILTDEEFAAQKAKLLG